MKFSSLEVSFPALQGSSLLGFLAALGTFRLAAEVLDMKGSRLKWEPQGSSHHPVIRFSEPVDPERLLECLHGALASIGGHYVLTVDKDLKIGQDVFRNLEIKSVEDFLSLNDTQAARIVAAFGCDAVGNDNGLIEDTAFRTMSGAGHQHFLEFMNVLAKQTSLEQLREALFGPWRYRDPSPVMRWDSEDDRRYALRWDEPSKDPVRTVRGANILAIAALPLFPTVPLSSHELATTGFKGSGSRNTFITWPIWTHWLTLDVVRSVLSMQELQEIDVSAVSLSSRGICALNQSQRITLGKYRNFTPARSL